jgi:hypothetical protein
MLSRLVWAVVLLACAFSLTGQEDQQELFRLELVPSGAMIALNEPTLTDAGYTFRAWPDGAPTTLKSTRVRKVTRLTGGAPEPVYQIDLNPSGTILARDNPTLKGSSYVFHAWRDGAFMSVRKADVVNIALLTGNAAYRAKQEEEGAALIGNLAMQGTGRVTVIGTLGMEGGSSQAGANNANTVGRSGINGAPVGNWSYQGTPGTSDAYGPANATMSGGVPTMPAATNGGAPPQ